MSINSNIEWTEATWNPTTGCTKISEGCRNCYAERIAKRLQAIGNYNYRNGFNLTIHYHLLKKPLTWKKPQIIFVNSMSDLFHERVPEAFILEVFEIIRQSPWHVFQILTKRSERLDNINSKIKWPKNCWLGVTVEREDYSFRISHLAQTQASVKFLSLEPLLGPIPNLDLKWIDWVIVGGESGPGARIMKKGWVTDIRDQCLAADTPFFFKQWGGFHRKKAGRLLDGRSWDQIPKKGFLIPNRPIKAAV